MRYSLKSQSQGPVKAQICLLVETRSRLQLMAYRGLNLRHYTPATVHLLQSTWNSPAATVHLQQSTCNSHVHLNGSDNLLYFFAKIC